MSEVIPFPKPNHRKVPHLCCVFTGPQNQCDREATQYVACHMIDTPPRMLAVVGAEEWIYKYFCDEHAPQDAEPLEFNKEE